MKSVLPENEILLAMALGFIQIMVLLKGSILSVVIYLMGMALLTVMNMQY